MANKTLSWEVEFCIAKAFIMCGFRKCTHVPECLIVILLFYYFVSMKWLRFQLWNASLAYIDPAVRV